MTLDLGLERFTLVSLGMLKKAFTKTLVVERMENTMAKSAAWQRKEGKSQKGGLNEKGRKSYEREHPGSDLKAPVKKEQAKICLFFLQSYYFYQKYLIILFYMRVLHFHYKYTIPN